MNMDCVEKQLVLNRLGETSLNDDIVEIIKEFAFKSFMRMEAERKKQVLILSLKIWIETITIVGQSGV